MPKEDENYNKKDKILSFFDRLQAFEFCVFMMLITNAQSASTPACSVIMKAEVHW